MVHKVLRSYIEAELRIGRDYQEQDKLNKGKKMKEYLNISVSKLKGGYSISADDIKRQGKPDRYVRSFVSFSTKKSDVLKILEGLLK